MKICFMNAAPLRISGDVGVMHPPLGILYLAAYIRERFDVSISVIDGYQTGYDKALDFLKRSNPDILGLSFTTQAAVGAYSTANEIKDHNPSVFIMCGGPHPTAMPEEVLKRSKADVAVMGEGEETAAELLSRLIGGQDYSNVPGIAYRTKDGKFAINTPRPLIKNLDSLPFPARDLIDVKKYPGWYVKKRGRDTSVLFTRGCPYNCVFCSNPVWKYCKPWVRFRSSKNIVDEIEHISSKYNIKELFDESDEFNATLNYGKNLCDEIIARDLDMSFKVSMRANNVDDELAEKMSKAGVWLALVGIESFNPATLKGIRKRIDIGLVEKSLGILKKHGIKTFAQLMVFNVWEEDGRLRYENKEDSLNTLKFAQRLIAEKKLDFITWSLTTPYPGSDLYEIAVRHKLIPENMIGDWEQWDSSCHFFLNVPDVSEADWMEVKNMGSLLQAKLLMKSGNMSRTAIRLYASRSRQFIRNYLQGLLK